MLKIEGNFVQYLVANKLRAMYYLGDTLEQREPITEKIYLCDTISGTHL